MITIPYINKYLMIVTDIHGNLDDFKYYLDLWLDDKSNHICFTGDLIHADDINDDDSLKILELVKEYNRENTFHVLMGNHEHSQLYGDDVYRYHVNQTEQFKLLVEQEYPNDYTRKYQEYKKILSTFDYYITTSNGLLISHTGIDELYLESILTNSINIYDLSYKRPYEQKFLTEAVWARPYTDYGTDTIDKILNHYGLKYWICGHTNYQGAHIYGDQLIFDSSHNTPKKYYLKIKLNKEYENIIEIMKKLQEMKLWLKLTISTE